ncbi:MAG TPA: glycosyltransferase [Candidatus Babeliales bacterium]|nr:glycosyltransferase [Candidatus Babeliales bacterium]
MRKLGIIVNKKVLIFTSCGGGGHTTASSAIETYLKNNYQAQSINVFDEILHHLDIFSIITLHTYSGEQLYNLLIIKKRFRLLCWFYSFGKWYINMRRKSIYNLLYSYCITTKPDLIISVIPILNYIILDVVQELNIPFLLIPTDLDVTTFINKITQPTYQHFYIGLMFDDEQIMLPLTNALIPKKQCFIIGAPLHIDFFKPKSKIELKHHYTIASNKPVIMILMGSHGSNDIEKNITQLIKISIPIHLIVCIGKNKHSKQIIDDLSLPENISVSIIEFTERIIDYMIMADILISKAGSMSLCEALYTDLPILLDATTYPLLPWEKFNHIFVKKHHMGDQIKDYTQITSKVSFLIKQQQELLSYKKNIKKLQKKNCQEELLSLIQKII